MGLLIKKQIKKGTILGVWENKESLELLTLLYSEKKEENITNKKRKKEWLATRLLLKELSSECEIFYNKYGAPKLFKKNISISHTHKFTAVIISNSPVGIDIEKIDERALMAASKFINLNMHKNLTNESATLIWSAKECLFKLHKKGNLNYIEDLLVNPFKLKEKGNINTYLYKNKYKLNYEKIYNHYLVYFCK